MSLLEKSSTSTPTISAVKIFELVRMQASLRWRYWNKPAAMPEGFSDADREKWEARPDLDRVVDATYTEPEVRLVGPLHERRRLQLEGKRS